MQSKDAFLLLILSAIWGASFLFMRIASPEFGPIALIFIRMFGAVIVVLPLLAEHQLRRSVLSHAGRLTVLGVLNHVLPFCLLAFATLRLEAGFTSLINATTPLFTAIIGAFWFRSMITRQQMIGLFIAFIGVFILSGDKLTFSSNGSGWAILAGLLATFCYGLSVHYSKTYLSHLRPKDITVGSMMASSTLLFIPALIFWPESPPSMQGWMSALLLAVVCTAIAFLVFFRVLASIGPNAAVTVTFLIPVFAIAWGVLILDEGITLQLLVGMLVTLSGTAITLGFLRLPTLQPKSLR